MSVEEVDVKLWDYYNNTYYADLEDKLDQTLEGALINDGNPIVLEEKVCCGLCCCMHGWHGQRRWV